MPRALAILLAIALLSATAWRDALAQPAGSLAPEVDPRLAEARQHFELGVAHFDRNEWQAALVEFLKSRELAPAKANTKNVAICLRKVGRFDEALDTFQALLRDFPDLPAPDRELARREIAELSLSVGWVEIRGAPSGARVSIDNEERGSTPLAGPLRLSAGTHSLRVVKDGALPFEARFDLAGQQTEVVRVKLAMLTHAGTLRVTEKSGRDVEVFVDGLRVGRTPWEGALAPGVHGIFLRGGSQIGTAPVRVTIELGKESVVDLTSVPLSSELQIDAKPEAAEIVVDGAPLGRGSWHGRLAPGTHDVSVTLDGYLPFAKALTLADAGRERVPVVLEPWLAKPRILLGLDAGIPLAVMWGGDLVSACKSPCSSSLSPGVYAQARATYRLPSGIGFGVHAGYLQLRTKLSHRSESVDPNGPAFDRGVASDHLRLGGLTAGLDADYVGNGKWPLVVRLSAGTLIGAVTDARAGTFVDSVGATYDISTTQYPRGTYFYLGPEMRLVYRAGRHLETSLGAKLLVLAALTRPTWDGESLVYAGETDRGGVFANANLTGSVMLAILPVIAATYAF